MRPHMQGCIGRYGMLAGLILMLTSFACRVGPEYSEPKIQVEQHWSESPDATLKRDQSELTEWWHALGDPTLNELVQRAYNNNPTLQGAGVRVLAAQAGRAIAVGLLFPQQQNAFADYGWHQDSENSGRALTRNSSVVNAFGLLTNPTGTFLGKRFPPGIDSVYQNWGFGLDVAWELDMWGKYRRGIEAADANVLATVATYDDVLVSLIAEVATNYVLLRTLEEQLDITKANIAIQQRGYELADTRAKGGTSTQLDPAQAKALLDDTKAQVPAIEASIRQTKNTLCILIGIPPQDITELLGEKGKIPSAPESVGLGVPAELLRRRPDIRRAERLLVAQSAQIGIAKADLYPSFSLNGDIGLSAEHFPDMFRGNSFQAFAGPSVRWALLNYGRIENNVRVQDALFQAQVSDYEGLVLRAQSEVENAMAGFVGARQQIVSLADSVDASTRAVGLAEQQYRGGIADYTRVLNTQQSLVVEQLRLVAIKGSVIQNLITLYRALGGGWQIRECEAMVPDEIKCQMQERTDWGRQIEMDRFQLLPASQPAEEASQ